MFDVLIAVTEAVAGFAEMEVEELFRYAAIRIKQTEGAKFRLRVTNERKNRSGADILIAVVDNRRWR